MGFILVKRTTPHAFDLGSGVWYGLDGGQSSGFTMSSRWEVRTDLANFIERVVYSGASTFDVANALAERLCDWAGQDEVVLIDKSLWKDALSEGWFSKTFQDNNRLCAPAWSYAVET